MSKIEAVRKTFEEEQINWASKVALRREKRIEGLAVRLCLRRDGSRERWLRSVRGRERERERPRERAVRSERERERERERSRATRDRERERSASRDWLCVSTRNRGDAV